MAHPFGKTIARHHPGWVPLIDGLHAALGEVLAEAGHALLDTAPVSAIQSIAWRAEINAAENEGDDDIDAAA